MQLKNEKQTGFSAEIKIIPPWAWTLAGIGFASTQILFNLGDFGPLRAIWPRALLGLLAGTIFGSYLLFIGYISSDARRRGMSALLWTLVAILIPNGLGILLYFILRQPQRKGCPQCGSDIRTEFNFCPVCSNKLSPSCPNCQRIVGGNDAYCPYCGTSLRDKPVPEYAARPGYSNE